MRIIDSSSLGNSGPVRTGQTNSVQPGGGASKTRGGASTSDTVELSGFSGKIRAAFETSAAERSERVSRIAQAVQSGSYQVDAKEVSRALIDAAIAPGGPR